MFRLFRRVHDVDKKFETKEQQVGSVIAGPSTRAESSPPLQTETFEKEKTEKEIFAECERQKKVQTAAGETTAGRQEAVPGRTTA